MQGLVRHGHDMIFPVLLGAHAALRRLTKAKVIVVLAAISIDRSQFVLMSSLSGTLPPLRGWGQKWAREREKAIKQTNTSIAAVFHCKKKLHATTSGSGLWGGGTRVLVQQQYRVAFGTRSQEPSVTTCIQRQAVP